MNLNIKDIFKKLKSVDIVKVFSLNALSTLIRMLSGMVSVKIVSAIIGPAGVALLGQLNNLNTILLGIANGGITTGVTKYVAESKEDEPCLRLMMSNALRIILFCTLCVSLVLILGHQYLSRYIMRSEEYGYVFVVFGFTIILYTLNSLLIAILNGFKRFKKYVVVNISGTVLGLIFSVSLVSLFGLPGALINAVTFQSVMFFVTLWLLRKEDWLRKDLFVGQLDKNVIKRYLGYSSMTLISLALLPVSQMLLRGYVISEISITEAGWWEGMNRISQMYLSVITTSLTVYYLPTLSEIKDQWSLRKEIIKTYKFITPLILAATFTIYLLKHFVVWLLFTPEFYPMEHLFAWQLIGDVFKVLSWLLAFQMVARAQTKLYITTEILFTLSYVALAFICLKLNGIVGLTQGYMLNYFLYLVLMIIIYRKMIFMKNPNQHKTNGNQ